MPTIAIIGQGYMGRTHAAAWKALGHSDDIRYVCVRTPGSPLDDAPAAQIVTDLQLILDDPDVDIISVCTPTPNHRQTAVRALEAGKNVLLEKPIALTVEDGLAILEAAERSAGVLMVAQVVRFFEGYAHLRQDVVDGRLGHVLSARARRFINRPDWADWWHDKKLSGGPVVDFAVHDYDQMNLFLGEPISVSCIAHDTLGPFETTIRYRGGGIGQVLSFVDLKAGAPFSSSIGLVGSNGFADYDFLAGAPTEASDGVISEYRMASDSTVSTATIAGEDPYTVQVAYFLRCATDGVEPDLSTTASAVRALEVSLAAAESLESGEVVSLHSRVTNAAALDTTRGA